MTDFAAESDEYGVVGSPEERSYSKEQGLRIMEATLRDVRQRIARLKDELERAYERERELVNHIADAREAMTAARIRR